MHSHGMRVTANPEVFTIPSAVTTVPERPTGTAIAMPPRNSTIAQTTWAVRDVSSGDHAARVSRRTGSAKQKQKRTAAQTRNRGVAVMRPVRSERTSESRSTLSGTAIRASPARAVRRLASTEGQRPGSSSSRPSARSGVIAGV